MSHCGETAPEPVTHYVLGFLFDEGRDHVLLIQKRRPAWQFGRLNGIGGKIEAGETPLQAMARECEEEAGLTDLDWQHTATLIGQTFHVEVFAAFSLAAFYAQQKTDETLRIFPHRNLPEGRIMPNLPLLIALALDESGVTKPLTIYDGITSADYDRPFQTRVGEWIQHTFGSEVAADKVERNHRFLEEALELAQACGCTRKEAGMLVDYVFGRPVGDARQEVGGTMNTLAALCNAHGIDLETEAEGELSRVWSKVDQIRAKWRSKPKFSPLPA